MPLGLRRFCVLAYFKINMLMYLTTEITKRFPSCGSNNGKKINVSI